jgi:hypothetical protein
VSVSALLGLLLLAQAPVTAPEQFFVGRTEGSGTVHVMLSGRHDVRDRGRGRMERGVLVIDQVVEEEGKPARTRQWRLSRSGANGITGTISDARGPVSGEVAGNVLRLRYRLVEGGVSVDQTITLHAGGRTAHNRMTFRRFGLNVATVETTIRRLD